jgi:hypothetical protein
MTIGVLLLRKMSPKGDYHDRYVALGYFASVNKPEALCVDLMETSVVNLKMGSQPSGHTSYKSS